jgi:hypothetical protein
MSLVNATKERGLHKMSKYGNIIESIFRDKFTIGAKRVRFSRTDFVSTASILGFDRIKNLGDIVYSFRYRAALPQSIQNAAPAGHEWIILGVGTAEYEFRLANAGKIIASSSRLQIKIPDSTPEILKQYAPSSDEQALLTKVRYNRLIDIFTGLTCYSIQNHYRTAVPIIGQIEVDEIYVGVSKNGAHYILPCQAKSSRDNFGIAQVYQDMLLCKYQYPYTRCRPIGIQFTSSDSMALLEFEVVEQNEIFSMKVVDEKHYCLVPRTDIQPEDLSDYFMRDNR